MAEQTFCVDYYKVNEFGETIKTYTFAKGNTAQEVWQRMTEKGLDVADVWTD